VEGETGEALAADSVFTFIASTLIVFYAAQFNSLDR
jgi:hypothetical protein